MKSVRFYRDQDLPFEVKLSNTSDNVSYKKHYHEEYSLGIVNKGESSFWCEGNITQVHPQSLVFIPNNVVHACNPNINKPWEYKMMYVHPIWANSVLKSHRDIITYPVVKDISNKETFIEVNKIIDGLVSSVSFLEKESSLLLLFEQVTDSNNKLQRSKKLRPKLKVIMEYLHDRFLEKITLDQLEQVSGLSKFFIIRSFKEEFSIPPHTYQTLLRINYAKNELRKERSITEVAYDAGFYDHSHFNKAFKNHVGVTPDKYQKLI